MSTLHLEDVSEGIGDDSFAFAVHQVEQSHRVSLACACVAVDEDEAIIAVILLIGIDEDVINDLLAPDIKDLPNVCST